MSWKCPKKVNRNTTKGQQQGRVFTTTTGDTVRSDGLGIGKRKIGNNVLKVRLSWYVVLAIIDRNLVNASHAKLWLST